MAITKVGERPPYTQPAPDDDGAGVANQTTTAKPPRQPGTTQAGAERAQEVSLRDQGLSASEESKIAQGRSNKQKGDNIGPVMPAPTSLLPDFNRERDLPGGPGTPLDSTASKAKTVREHEDFYRPRDDSNRSQQDTTYRRTGQMGPLPTTPTTGTTGTTLPGSPAAEVGSDYTAVRDQLLANMENPTLAPGASQEAIRIEEQAEETLDPNDPNYQMSEQARVAATGFAASEAAMATATTPAEMAAAQAGYAEVAAAAKGTVSRVAVAGTAGAASAQAAIQDLNAVDPKTMAKALTHEVPNGATVQGQLDGLLEGLETGDVPQWAKPAIAAAESAMASRGMSSSSVGRNAMFNSIISAAMPIAQADAKAKLSVFQQDISNEQQAMLANSTFFQNLTMKNLDNKQQAAIVNATNLTNASIANAQNQTQASVSNAQAFLQMDITNLNNEQQAQMASAQFRQQSMLTNAAAENTARQFNAANQQQADQFNANLANSVEQFNATQQNASKQFNANAENAMAQFNSQQGFQREQFNTQNATAISQSNAQWRRQMNQMNTASANAVMQANAMNKFNLSNQALSFLWQEQRDAAKWANDNTQNAEERKTRMAIAALSNESMQDANTLASIKDLAGAAISIFDGWND